MAKTTEQDPDELVRFIMSMPAWLRKMITEAEVERAQAEAQIPSAAGWLREAAIQRLTAEGKLASANAKPARGTKRSTR